MNEFGKPPGGGYAESELSHKKAQEGTKKGSIESGNRVWAFVSFCAFSWLNKSGQIAFCLMRVFRGGVVYRVLKALKSTHLSKVRAMMDVTAFDQ